MKFVREPLVQFLVVGAALFALYAFFGGDSRARETALVVTPARIEQLALGFARTWQRPPTRAELDGLVEDFVRDDVLYREGLAMGLAADDTIVRRRVRQKLEFVTDDLAAQITPSDADLQTYLNAHADVFRGEPQVAFRHVYINRDRRGERAEADARELLARLAPDAEFAELGDPLMLPNEFALESVRDVAANFGDAFARSLVELAPGSWAGPIESGFGLHLVFVTERVAGGAPTLDEVRDSVAREWANAQRTDLLETAYRKLRERYQVEIHWPASEKTP